MGALRKVEGRTLIPSVPGEPEIPPTTNCTFTPTQPQYRPPTGDDDDSGGGGGCQLVPLIECRYQTEEERASRQYSATGEVCQIVGIVEVCS